MSGLAAVLSPTAVGLAREAARVRRCPWGADDAFPAFYAATARPLWAYLVASCGDRALADDLLQEAYLRFLAADPAEESRDGCRAYLYRIAGNLLRDGWRRDRCRPAAVALGEGAAEVAAPGGGPELGLDVRRALADLSPRERQLVWLAHVEGLDHREIGVALGLATASVKVLLFRARRRLAARLDTRNAVAGDR